MEWFKEHVIEVITFFIGALGAWFTLKTRVDHVTKALDLVTVTLEKLDKALNIIDKSVATLTADYDSLIARIDTLEGNFGEEIKRLRDDRHNLANIIGNLQGEIRAVEKIIRLASEKKIEET